MKTFITTSLIALVITLGARADVASKGGASGLLKAPAVSDAAAPAAMKCGMCKSEFAIVKTPVSKGTTPTVSTVEKHGCASCVTTFTTTGQGKAKTETAVHGCKGCGKS